MGLERFFSRPSISVFYKSCYSFGYQFGANLPSTSVPGVLIQPLGSMRRSTMKKPGTTTTGRGTTSRGEDGIRTHDLLTASQVYLFDSSMIWFF